MAWVALIPRNSRFKAGEHSQILVRLMNSIVTILNTINHWIWGVPLLVLLLGTGLFLTILLRGLQFRYLWYSLRLAFIRKDNAAEGDISQFQALMTAMSATIGIGSIAGVATAVAVGGLGAIFWMWVTALFGMATKYAEAILAIKYRIHDSKGEMCGGPMYYLERGLEWKSLAVFFALMGAITALTTGNLVQSHSVAAAAYDLFHLSHIWTGVILALFTALVLIKGIKSIGWVTEYLVPIMAILYLVGSFVIIILQYRFIPSGVALIFSSAFTGQAAVGAFAGSTLMMALRIGAVRGVFSNEAGLGSSPIAAAAAKTDRPGRQAMISMSGVFLATFVVCTVTGLVIATTQVLGLYGADGKLLNGSAMIVRAFNTTLPGSGWIVMIALILFGYSTILGWAYYGEKCTEYLFGEKAIFYYRMLVVLCVVLGSFALLEVVWSIADICNGLMALPNLLGLLGLSRVIYAETTSFLKVVKQEKRAKA